MRANEIFAAEQKRINTFLSQQLDNLCSEQSTLRNSVAYALLAGGKRIRPLLVYATCDAYGLPYSQADYIAAAIEMIHTYSLIHDDLPCMDDDNLRRGRPTCHIAFNEATAVLAGDALQAIAFEVLAQTPCQPKQIVKLIQIMAKACGLNGMAGGQSLDLEAENRQVSLAQLQKIHAAKTGALLTACVDMVAVLVKIEDQSDHLHQFAQHFGIAFQIIDDVLDVTAETKTLGKPSGSDQGLNKSTYPNLMGLDGAQKEAKKHIKLCFKHLNNLSRNHEKLHKLTNFVLDRTH